MIRIRLSAPVLVLLSFVGLLPAPADQANAKAVRSLEDCNVVWKSPSEDSLGSMPLGNGDVGANVWVEPNGDLLFYISKVDAYDAQHLLPKLGRVRMRLQPPLPMGDFCQELSLRDASIVVRAGDVELRVWVDANHPVLRVTGASKAFRGASIGFESLRPCSERLDSADRLAWAYRNTSSLWIERVRAQNSPEFAAKAGALDPLLNRTSGCRLSGTGFQRDGPRTLRLSKSRSIDMAVQVSSAQTTTLDEWFSEMEKPAASDWAAHRKWWREFWDRSWILVSGCGAGAVSLDQGRFTQFAQGSLAYAGHKEIDGTENAFQLSQRYALERFCEACAGRGAVPPPYNGSIFTMDMPAGSQEVGGPRKKPADADQRDWDSLPFMWQNTRHPYWAMAARGDYDTMRPGLKFVLDGLDVGRDRSRALFGHDGAFIMEASLWRNVGVFDWAAVPQHLRYHFLATIEMPAIMAEYYEHTRDREFLDKTLLPCADEFIKFYELQFPKREGRGKMVMAPAAAVETFRPVTNPNTEITGLRFLLTKLLSFEIGAERAAHWSKLLAELPDAPLRRINGLDLLAVGDDYAPGREICESPEMYTVYPFRQAWLGAPALLAAARQSLHLRTVSLDGTADGQAVETGGWQLSPVQAAYLGLAREAARLTSLNFDDRFIFWTDNVDPRAPWPSRPRARFPAFWETKMDYTPDNDHGAVSANALQSMLLIGDGKRIFLLPAWPEDWDVSFKLRAPFDTTVECVYAGGRVRSLKVTPESRRADIVDMSAPDNRIRTLVEVARGDRNHLFGLPPMLDGLPKPGPATGPWLARYGESVTGVRGGPWPGCVYRDNVVYVHMLDGPLDPPAVAARLISSKYLTGKGEKPDTILKLEYDCPVEEFARAAASQGSLTIGQSGPVVDLGRMTTFNRLEFSLDVPDHRRGEGRPFELQVRDADGSWRMVHKGRVYGKIYGKAFEPVTAREVRVKIDAPFPRFDLFKDER